MKTIILTVSLIFSIAAILATLISAPTYGVLFAIGAISGTLALTGLIYLGYVSKNYRFYVVALGFMPLYALVDILLRYCWGIRVTDFLR